MNGKARRFSWRLALPSNKMIINLSEPLAGGALFMTKCTVIIHGTNLDQLI